ncbi:Glycosyltransferase involved in cell wall bisynthesis [Alteromonadaceae bacterium Bs31]|nr:Glycosyltransferase involved in cell wall bisynthesis [Alteromonadaceae bacterium Bs31]
MSDANSDDNPHSVNSISRLENLNVAIISDAAPGRNGVGTFYADLLQHLESRVKRIKLLCPTIEKNGKWNAGLVLPLPGDATQKLCMPNPFSLQRQLGEIKPDIVILATPGVYGLLGAFLAGRMKIPAIAGFHTSFEELTRLYWNNSAAGQVVHSYFKVSNNYLFKSCRLVLANSEAMVQQAEQLNAPATELISTLISPLFTDTPLRPYAGEFKRVLFAGRLAPEKNIDTIIQAAEKMPQVAFSFAGDGPLREQLDSAANSHKNIKTLGWLNRDKLREQIDQHDCLVLPSHFESFGTIALEAMARQRLVVVSSHCGIADSPAHSDGLYIMNNASLHAVLENIAAQSPELRILKAKIALKITQALNEKSLNHWSEVFCRIISR